MGRFWTTAFNRLLYLVTILVFWQGLALAESAAADDLSFIFEEEDLFISATQSARTLGKAPAIATVITAKQLRDMGARNLLDALKTVPGFGVSYASSFSVEKSLEVRGIKTDESEKVLLMIDGHRVNTPIGGSWTLVFDEFPVSQIKRIEIIRGPGSALYGANAFVAVINIIMQKPGELEGTALTAGAGSDKTLRQNIQVGHKDGDIALIGSYDHGATDGNRQFIIGDVAGQSGFTNFWRNNHTGHFITQYDRWSLTGFIVQKRRGTPLGITNQVDSRSNASLRQLFGEAAFKDHFGTAAIELKFGIDHFVADPEWVIGPSLFNPQLENLTLSPRLNASFDSFHGHFLTLGVEYDHMRQFDVIHIINGIDFSSSFNHNQAVTRQVWAAYAQDEWEITRDAIFTAGVRLDHYSDFGTTVNPRIAFVWSPLKAVDVKLLYGRAFRAPSFVELYEINNPAAVGNPDLKPEIMNTLEAGIAWHLSSAFQVNADIFYNRFTDRIFRQSVILGGSKNQGGAKIWGFETEIKADVRDALYGYLNYAYQLSEDDTTGASLADVPKHRVQAGTNAGFFDDKIIAHADVRWTGQRQRAPGDPRAATPSSTIIDLAAHTQRLMKGVDLALKIHNLFDRDVFDPSPLPPPVPGAVSVTPGFPRSGRTWLVEAGYAF
ncbi:MAG: TonB-dependent receptor [Mariprofundaceae bacterium]